MRTGSLLMICVLSVLGSEPRKTLNQEIQKRSGIPASNVEISPGRAFTLPAGMSLATPLSPDDAAAIALANNPTLEADLAALGIASADLRDASLLRNPSIQTLLPVGLKPFEILLLWPIEDLWQRKKRVLAAQKNLETVSSGLVQVALNLIRDVRLAHADLDLAQKRGATLQESATLRARIAVLTQRRQDAGDASGIEVSLAQADARSAEELATRSQADISLAQVRLRQLLGLRDSTVSISVRPGPGAQPLPQAMQLVDSAYSARPDLRAAELNVEAFAYRAKWQRTRIFNFVLPMLSSKETGTPLNLRSGPGLQIELPLFNKNQGLIARADAEVIQAAWRYSALRDRVALEVRDAHTRVEQAEASITQLKTQLQPAVEQAIAQTETAFRNGDASHLNVLESTRQRFDSILRQHDAEAALLRARAELERSIGRKL